MKKIFALLVLLSIFFSSSANAFYIEYDGKKHNYTDPECTLLVDGKVVETPFMPPLFINNRTLIPVRELCEALGALVTYTPNFVEIDFDGFIIELTIGSLNTKVNGKQDYIEDGVPPTLINYPGEYPKTMVPVRYIAETLGMNVQYDQSTTTVIVDSSESSVVATKTEINDMEFSFAKSGTLNIDIFANNKIESKISCFKLSNPTRVVVDIPDTSLSIKKLNNPISDSPVSAIRLGHENNKTRIVIDVSGKLESFKAEKSGNKVSISVLAAGGSVSSPSPTKTPEPTPSVKPTASPKPTESSKPTSSPKPTTSSKPTASPENSAAPTISISSAVTKPTTTANFSKKLIVLDAGHGGEDPGAVSEVLDHTIKEKDITLSIIKKIGKILTNEGHNVVYTRSSDTYPTLTERAKLANEKGAALFVSVHMNSATSESPNGTETYYSEINNTDFFGATSKELATNIQKKLQKALNSINRGVKTANHAVTKNSLMPAVLIEVGFISNKKEAALLETDAYQTKAAEAIAEGIMDTWYDITMPKDWDEIVEDRKETIIEWETNN